MISEIIKKHLQKALKNAGFGELPLELITLEHPKNESFGDYSTNIALKVKNKKSKIKIESTKQLAQVIIDELDKDEELSNIISKIKVAGPGFINFWLSEEYLSTSIIRIIEVKNQEFPQYHFGDNKKVMVEFAHPNTHKPFHIGHLRNIIIGESLVRLLEALGNTVIRANYEGDVGLHIAKCLWGLKRIKNNPSAPFRTSELKITNLEQKIKLLGEAYVVGNNAYEDSEESRKEIIEINKKIYTKDTGVIRLWEETRKWSLDYFENIYKRVDSHFDRLFFESEVFEKGLAISKDALSKNILKESEKAVVFDGTPFSLHTRVFITKDGYPTYEGKELGLAELETSEFGSLDKIIHVVAPEQSSFFAVTFKVEELLDKKRYKGIQYHFPYGYVRLSSGKMSSRKGTVLLGEWLLDEVKSRILKTYKITSPEIAEIIAIGAVKYSFLKVGAKEDISFDIDQSINLDGDSGPYLQYTYARARSVLRKLKIKNYELKIDYKFQISNIKLTQEEFAVLRILYKFPEVVLEAGRQFAPNLICSYLYDLASKFNLFYQKDPILKANEENKKFRLAITEATSIVIKSGLELLGIKVLEKM
jgi:arginyl-tRNA synthetase